MDHSKRSLLFGRRHSAPLRPPWGIETTILSACTGCGDCARVFPSHIIEIGAGGYPEIWLGKGECTFCGRCAEACRAPVFDLARPAFQHKVAIGDRCLSRSGIECRSCQDACPENAIHFRPRLGSSAEPVLQVDLCTGCGACLVQCPANAIEPV